MTCRGIVKGKTIEFQDRLPFPEGQQVNVTVLPMSSDDLPGSPAFALKMMKEPPHLEPGDIEAFEGAIEEGKLPVSYRRVFDQDEER